MSAEAEDSEADLGIRAFQDMSLAMDRLGVTLKQANAQRIIDLRLEGEENSAAGRAAQEAMAAAKMAQKAAQEALQASQTEARSSILWTVLGSLLVAVFGLLMGYYLGDGKGWNQGHAEGMLAGYADAHDEKAAAAWANTPNGHRAFILDQVGSLSLLSNCSGQGWRTEKQDGRRVCFPGADSHGSMTGWFVP